MESDIVYSDILHGDWEVQNEVVVSTEEVHPVCDTTEESQLIDEGSGEPDCREEDVTIDVESHSDFEDFEKEKNEPKIQNPPIESSDAISSEPTVFISPPYYSANVKQEPLLQQVYYPSFAHGYSSSSTYHQPFVSMVRQKKTSALTAALQRQPTANTAPVYVSYVPGYPYEYGHQYAQMDDEFGNEDHDTELNECSSPPNDSKQVVSTSPQNIAACSSTAYGSAQCGKTEISHAGHRPNDCFSFQDGGIEGNVDKIPSEINNNNVQDERHIHRSETVQSCGDGDISERGIRRHDTKKKLLTEDSETGAAEGESEDEDEDIAVVDDERDIGAAPTTVVSDKDDFESATSSCDTKHQKSSLKKLLLQPVKKPAYQDYSQQFAVSHSALGTSQSSSGAPLPKTMQFYQPPAQQHLARNTPPPGFAQPYGMGMRPHEEETRQIMNLDSQHTHSSSPTSSWNQPYGQMTNLNAYQQRGPNLYAPPVPPQMVHQSGPPGVVPTSNPYYPTPGPPPPHHHMQPQAPMMPPGMHGQQQQQPYYNTQSPLTGSSPSMTYGNPQIPAPPPPSNGSAPIFNFSKPRTSNEGAAVNGGGHRRKKHHDLSSPRYNNNGSEDVDGSIFPDMSDFPLLDVVQSKAKKDAGRKPCRPHLCEQSRMLISRVCHFHREFVKRLPSRHPLANSPLSKPDQWTSQIMGISLATVRKCIDMAVEEEVFTRCTDKNLVNLTPSERAEREELLSKLSTVFEDEKTLGAGTAGMTIAEYSPRRSYSNTLIRQSTDEKSSNSSFANGGDYGSCETTLLNLDDHSNHSKDFAPTSGAELNDGGQVFEELGPMGSVSSGGMEEKSSTALDTPKRGRPRKTPGMPTSKQSKRKESQEDIEMSEEKDEHDKKTEDEDETNEETEKKSDELQQVVLTAEREDDAASSEGTARSETATPEPAADTSVAKKTRAAARRKNTKTVDEELPTSAKKKRGSVTAATAGVPGLDDENSDHKMVTRARSRQP